MGKRYYCEYCQRAFQDNITARKKHLNSASHLRNKQSWFQSFGADAKEFLGKKPCYKFLSTGSCPFGNNCKYRHQAEQEAFYSGVAVSQERKLPSENILKSWINGIKERKLSSSSECETICRSGTVETLPGPENNDTLPPSMQPPPPEGWPVDCNNVNLLSSNNVSS
uniref:Zinc finger protein ZF(C3H/U1like)-1 n=1 Tax=Phallusia mammillata TaxID=59560 RepID=A0A6F9DWY1_9ASCI|nr:zinc finger protein ZF(C3H/U1like)-1 [Phallusia mammillata]